MNCPICSAPLFKTTLSQDNKAMSNKFITFTEYPIDYCCEAKKYPCIPKAASNLYFVYHANNMITYNIPTLYNNSWYWIYSSIQEQKTIIYANDNAVLDLAKFDFFTPSKNREQILEKTIKLKIFT